jgi:hypothetical protein
VAEATIEQLRRAFLKQQESTHVFVCLRLLYLEWSRQLHKATDLVVSLPAGVDQSWTNKMLEPLTIGSLFLFVSCQPGRSKETIKILHLEITIPGMWNREEVNSSNILRELFQSQ